MEILCKKLSAYYPDEKQWTLTKRKGEYVVLNLYSLEEFQFYIIQPSNNNLKHIFNSRLTYTLPNTPKLACMSCKIPQTGQQSYLILGQKPQYSFQKLLNYHRQHETLLQLCMQLITTTEMLTKKYGFFQLTHKMINASKGPTLIVWISQNVLDNQIQRPLPERQPGKCQNILVRKIINLILQRYFVFELESIVQEDKAISFYEACLILKESIQNKRHSSDKTIKKKHKLPDFIQTMREKQKQDIAKVMKKTHKKAERLSLCLFSRDNSTQKKFFEKKTISSSRKLGIYDSVGGVSKFNDLVNQLCQEKLKDEAQKSQFEKQKRESGFTESTANYFSVNTFSNTRTNEQGSRLSFEANKKLILSSFGFPKQNSYLIDPCKQSCKFNVKDSKVISQVSEQLNAQTPSVMATIQQSSQRVPSSQTKESGSSRRDDLERDLSHLFKSSTNDRELFNLSSQLPAIEEELNRILFD